MESPLCIAWKNNNNINPETGHKISKDGPIYKKYEKICSICDLWRNNPDIDPVTQRKLNKEAKNGIYSQLVLLCAAQVAKKKSSTKAVAISAITPAAEADLEDARNKLIAAINKKIAPILHKSETLKARIEFKNIITNYLEDIKPCINEYQDKLYLFKGNNIPTVYFNKRIGTNSAYGEAYLNMGHGFAKLLKFSCKIMAVNSKHTLETKLLKQMSTLAEKGSTPNMPITYKILKCKSPCKLDACPKPAKDSSYYIIINELADYDLETWFKETHTTAEYESIFMQIMFAIFSFHSLSYLHNDTHLGTFLIHKIKPGGYWRYQFNNENIYVPNCGYLLVMWDPGRASKINFTKTINDYIRQFYLINKMDSIRKYRDIGLKSIPDKLSTDMLTPMINIFYEHNTERDAIWKIIRYIKDKKIITQHIHIGGVPPDYLLNIHPYTMG
jgi:hypothetical protein